MLDKHLNLIKLNATHILDTAKELLKKETDPHKIMLIKNMIKELERKD